MVMSSKWMRLIGLVGFTAVLVSCKQTPQAPMNANYATMKITVSDKKFSTSYSATIRGRQDIDIYPQVSGTIERLCVRESPERTNSFRHRPSTLQGSLEYGYSQR